MKNQGLVIHNKHLAYGIGFGRLQKFPMPIKEFIVKVWNEVACLIFGHNLFSIPSWDEVDEETGETIHWDGEPLTCSDCCRHFDENKPPRYCSWIR